MLWHKYTLTKRLIKERRLKKCERCHILYKKALTECPHCSDINDKDLNNIIQNSSNARVDIGKLMLYGAVAIIAIMIIITLSN